MTDDIGGICRIAQGHQLGPLARLPITRGTVAQGLAQRRQHVFIGQIHPRRIDPLTQHGARQSNPRMRRTAIFARRIGRIAHQIAHRHRWIGNAVHKR